MTHQIEHFSHLIQRLSVVFGDSPDRACQKYVVLGDSPDTTEKIVVSGDSPDRTHQN